MYAQINVCPVRKDPDRTLLSAVFEPCLLCLHNLCPQNKFLDYIGLVHKTAYSVRN